MYTNPRLILTIQNCQTMCENMVSYLLGKPDVKERQNQIKHLRDCADICSLTSKYIARDSIFSKHTAELCSYICRICGKECAKFPDKESQNCSMVCLNCEEECKKFALT